MTEQDVQFLGKLPFLSGLSGEAIEALLKDSEILERDKDESIFYHGDPATAYYVIRSGWIKLSRETQDGNEAVLGLLSIGDMFGEAVMFEGANYPFSASTLEKTGLYKIPAHALKKQALSNPEVLHRMLETMSDNMEKLQLENEHLAQMTAPQRIGCLFLQFATQQTDCGPDCTIHLPFDKSLAAARLGMKPETFSRALKQLHDVGVIVKGPDITIADFETLAEYCCNNCSSDPNHCLYAEETGCAAKAGGQGRCGGCSC